ncbi:MAG: 2-hydroxychromene-2-carboxylate isomerase [Burkholderiaceae bacterium]|nr:2-hydroxychromene-2-carboxylate isomerase [Burkholderiaceae bacterium]
MSPFAYLAHGRLVELARQYDRPLHYVPIELGQAKRAAGNTGPSNREIPPKIAYLLTDMARWAERYGIPIEMPGSLDSRLLNLGAFLAIDQGSITRYATDVWARTWAVGTDLDSPEAAAVAAGCVGLSADAFRRAANAPAIVQRYEAAIGDAISAGVFGVPMVRIGDEMWWGNDRLDFVAEQLARDAGDASGA